jgi:hypothetical protein
MMPLWDGIEAKHQPTDVHLQVYDGQLTGVRFQLTAGVGHDIPLFCMTKPGHCAVRAIGSFSRWVTPSAPGSLPTPASTGPDPTGSEASSGVATPLFDQPLVETPHDSPPLGSGDGPREGHRDSLGYIVPEPPQEPTDKSDMGYVDARLRDLRLEGRGSQSSGSPGPSKKPSKGMSWGALPKAAPGRAGWPGIYDGPNVS